MTRCCELPPRWSIHQAAQRTSWDSVWTLQRRRDVISFKWRRPTITGSLPVVCPLYHHLYNVDNMELLIGLFSSSRQICPLMSAEKLPLRDFLQTLNEKVMMKKCSAISSRCTFMSGLSWHHCSSVQPSPIASNKPANPMLFLMKRWSFVNSWWRFAALLNIMFIFKKENISAFISVSCGNIFVSSTDH